MYFWCIPSPGLVGFAPMLEIWSPCITKECTMLTCGRSQPSKTSRPTWVSNKDVVLKKENGSHKPSQPIPELSHFYSTQAKKSVSAPVALSPYVDVSLP